LIDLRQKLLATFQVEHKEHLERIRSILTDLEQKAGSPARADLDEAFRRAHSLKGAARVVDLHPVETLAHRLETLFSRVREDGVQLDLALLGVVHQVLDSTEDWMGALVENRPLPNTVGALQAIETVLGMETEAPAQAPTHAPPRTPEQAASALPFQKFETVRVNAENLDRLLRSTDRLTAEILRQESLAQQLVEIGQQISEVEREWERVRKASPGALRSLPANPGLARVARYLEFVDHQVHSLVGRTRTLRLHQQRSSWSLRQLCDELQQEVKQARIVPAESLYEGFHKMVRDLARDQGKEIEFRVTGLEVQADRLVLQALKDPLMHLLRNAVTHGIESPEVRARNGKSKTGRVSLRLQTQGNRLTLAVEDDGQGVDLGKIAKVATQRGMLNEAEAAALSPRELGRLIFQPGFSTSEVVTDLAGRGMGLSVVYEAVERLQGEVEIQPANQGSTSILLSVPLSISTHRLLLVSCWGQTFCIPAHAIERLCRLRPQDVQTVEGKPVFCLDGNQIPLTSLARVLELGQPELDMGAELPVMILHSASKRVAVAVDGFLAERDALIQDLGIFLPSGGKINGGILTPDGSVALVLNPAGIIEALQKSNGTQAFAVAKPASKERTFTILVADDSITTRTLERSILEAHGYHVRVAVDGLEALERLRAEPADLVIADVQMPRMDGFTLLAEIKKDPRLAQTPVIIVSSLERRQEQEQGLALGADAYIVKRKFDQQELLDVIRQIL
jgi:two-component system, chemotaxis family, sensor kinase CheA